MEFFENKIRPVLAQHCYKCHSTQSKKLKAELYLDNRERALQGGESGPSIIPGKADSSLLYRAVLYKEESLEMPPTRKLPDAVIADFKRWIDMGAPWPKSNEPQVAEKQGIDYEKYRKEHWSLKPIQNPAPPEVANGTWPRNPIDQFVLARLEDAGMKPSPEADRRALIRRAYFDLVGLPPTPEEVAAFVAGDTSWDQVIEELLASPRYAAWWTTRLCDITGNSSRQIGEKMFREEISRQWYDWIYRRVANNVSYDRIRIAERAVVKRRISFSTSALL